MLKKTFAAAGVAALLLLGGASAASAVSYPPDEGCTAVPATIAVGETSVITCVGLDPNVTGTFTVSGPGVVSDTLSSVVFASTSGTSSVTKTTSATGEVSVNFRGPAAASFTVSLEAENGQSGSATVTVTDTADGGDEDLAGTGGTVPAAAIWLGVGAIGIGGIAVAAAVARRRAHQSR